MLPHLGRITLFPIKSLDGVEVRSVLVLAGGALEFDRRWALVDADNRFVNGKRTAAIQRIRASYDLEQSTVALSAMPGLRTDTLSLLDEQSRISEWISGVVGIQCRLVENATGGLPDDTDAPGPTLVSSATLAEVASWFPGVTREEVRRRFRANLELEGVEPFWEDRLIGPIGTEFPFRIGDVNWLGVNPCQRCAVPTRDSNSGQATAMFQKTFARERERHLPAWAERSRFDHFYRLAVNTRLAAGQVRARLCCGDLVSRDD